MLDFYGTIEEENMCCCFPLSESLYSYFMPSKMEEKEVFSLLEIFMRCDKIQILNTSRLVSKKWKTLLESEEALIKVWNPILLKTYLGNDQYLENEMSLNLKNRIQLPTNTLKMMRDFHKFSRNVIFGKTHLIIALPLNYEEKGKKKETVRIFFQSIRSKNQESSD